MSGRRAKALRKAFQAKTGRTPAKTTWLAFDRYIPSEWRRLKKAAARSRRSGKPLVVAAPPAPPRRRRAVL